MDNTITEIMNEMADYLNVEQQKRLQQVLLAKLSKNRQNTVPATNEDYKPRFIGIKKRKNTKERH